MTFFYQSRDDPSHSRRDHGSGKGEELCHVGVAEHFFVDFYCVEETSSVVCSCFSHLTDEFIYGHVAARDKLLDLGATMFMHDFDLLLDKVGRVSPYKYVLFFAGKGRRGNG